MKFFNSAIPWMVLGLIAPVSYSAPVITAVYTTYSAGGVPSDLNITGTGLCSTTACATKPIVKLAGVQQTVTGGTTTGIGVKLGAIADGDYVLNLLVGSFSINYNLTIRSISTGGAGSNATVSVGTTTTGGAGTSASVSNSGTNTAAVLNFTIPRGATGAMGATGATGPSGPTGPAGVPGPQGIQGMPGPSGAIGATGATGPAGPKGDKGDPGNNGAGLSHKGKWTDTDSYSPLDVVTHEGSSYIALRAGMAINPATDTTSDGGYWALLAARGTDGVAGKDGAIGPDGPPGAAGPPGFDGPQGPEGPPGIAGPIGPEGPKGEPGPPGPGGIGFRGLYEASTNYSPGELVYTAIDLVGLPYYCQYFARAPSSGVIPREHSDPADSDAAWFTTDPTCRSFITPPKYSVIDLYATLGNISVIALNNKNQILGSENGRLFIYSPNTKISYIEFTNNEFRDLRLMATNEKFELVGSALRTDGTRTAILIRNGIIEDIGINIGTEESEAVSINNFGQIALNYKEDKINYQPYFYDSINPYSIPIIVPKDLYSGMYGFQARSINDNGTVAISRDHAVFITYLWKAGHDLIPRGQVQTYKINNSDTVVGLVYDEKGSYHAGFSSGSTATVIQHPADKSGFNSPAIWSYDINNKGDVVGFLYKNNLTDETSGYIYYRNQIFNLNYVTDKSPETPNIGMASLINDNGWIIAGSLLLIPK